MHHIIDDDVIVLRCHKYLYFSLGIQTTIALGIGSDTAYFLDSPLASTPVKGSLLRPNKRPRLELEEEESDTSNDQEPLDSTYTPGESVITEDSDTLFEMEVTHDEAKYVVFESCLKQLFENCPVCKRDCEVQRRKMGTFVAFTQRCLHCDHFNKWESQPIVGSTPVGNLQLSAATYFTGASFIQLEKVGLLQVTYFL